VDVNRTRWIILVVIALGVVGGGWWWKTRTHKDTTRYRTAAVERGDITSTVSATGSVQPVLQVQVGSQVSGTLSKLYVDYNSQVKAGQVLAQLETSAFRARLAQAEASVARAQAALRNGQLGLKRAIELQKGDYVAQADVDAAQATVDQQKADLKQAQASLESAQVDLSHTTITSPIDGVVISRSIDVGQTVAASLQAPQLFIIGNDLRQMQVQTNIDEADIGSIRPGLQAQFTVDAYPDAQFTGTVVQVRLVPQVSSNVVTYQTLISARNDDLRLRPGMTANVTIMIETHTNVLKVVNGALRFKPAGFAAGARRGQGGMNGGNGGGGNPGGGMRHGIAALWDRVVPAAQAQEQGGPGGGSRQGANDPYVQQVRDKVAKGELTRDQARELIHRHFAEQGGAGAAPSGGSGAPPAGAGRDAAAAKPGPGGKGTHGGASAFGGRERGRFENVVTGGSRDATPFKPGGVFILKDGKPVRVRVMTGISDGTFTEVRTDSLKEGDMVVTGLESPAASANGLTPPPGMGGPGFRGPGGGGGRR
jgi:HlyD family secretion protein